MQPRRDLTFGRRNCLEAAEATDVGRTDVGDHCQIRLGATGETLDKDGFESLAYALGCFPAIDVEAFADLPRRCEDGRVSRDECRAWWARRQRETPPPLSTASYTMVAFFLNYDERRAGVLDDAGFAGLYQGLLDAGYDLGSLEDLLAEMGGTSFRDFVGWFEGLCAAADDGVDELCAAAEGVAVDA